MPGGVDTPLAHSFAIPKGANPELIKSVAPFGMPKLISPESVAATIAFLASDEAIDINGTDISVDGGKI